MRPGGLILGLEARLEAHRDDLKPGGGGWMDVQKPLWNFAPVSSGAAAQKEEKEMEGREFW